MTVHGVKGGIKNKESADNVGGYTIYLGIWIGYVNNWNNKRKYHSMQCGIDVIKNVHAVCEIKFKKKMLSKKPKKTNIYPLSSESNICG